MTRFALLLLALSLGLASAACKSAPAEPPKAPTGDYKGEHKIRFQDEAPKSKEGGGGSDVLGWVAAPFENVVYVPWKLVGGAMKGTADGVSAGFGKDPDRNQRMPALGLLFLPVNLVLGLLTGAAEGVAEDPILVGPDDSFGHEMSRPLRRPTTIWWY